MSIWGNTVGGNKPLALIGEIKKAVEDVTKNHTSNKNNPHGVTAAQVGAVTSDQVTEMIDEALGVIENGSY
jgi:hypothetical protein